MVNDLTRYKCRYQAATDPLHFQKLLIINSLRKCLETFWRYDRCQLIFPHASFNLSKN
jgi:hypothetical protein